MEIKEVKDLLIAMDNIALLLVSVFKDGVQAHDIADIFAKIEGNPDLCQKLTDAYNGIDKVAAELSDLSLAEGIELGMLEVQYVPKFIETLKA